MFDDRSHPQLDERRSFLRSIVAGSAVALSACVGTAAASAGGAHDSDEHDEAEVTPGEDLMQEHGLLERILLVYDEAAYRIEQNASFDVSVVARAAAIVKRFVEQYHEQLEEQFVFPRLEKAQRQVELVAVLRRQHQRGRDLTTEISRLAGGKVGADLATALRSFQRMYRPHAAREETVLLPAFREINGKTGYRELGEQFEAEEHRRFGEGGFEKNVAEVAALEEALGIADLAKFTP